jgi:hypothetical protein
VTLDFSTPILRLVANSLLQLAQALLDQQRRIYRAFLEEHDRLGRRIDFIVFLYDLVDQLANDYPELA